jgi:lysophospholipase L1-like esterase
MTNGWTDGIIPSGPEHTYLWHQLYEAANKSANDGIWDWEDPATSDREYNTGSIIRHSGVLWESTADSNTGEPGVDADWQLYLNKLMKDVDSFTDLQAIDVSLFTSVILKELHPGIPESGDPFHYDATIDKSTAGDGWIVDPSVSLEDQGTGVGFGCWIRQEKALRNIAKWSESGDIIVPRHKYLAEKIRSATSSNVPNGFCIGNSIMQGTGSSSINFTIPRLVATKLQALYNVATTNDWVPSNKGVGGSTTSLALAYVSDNSDNSTNLPISGTLTTDKDYAIILTLRNDVSLLSDDRSEEMVRATLQALRNKNIEPIFITDPPEIDMLTGDVLDTQSNFGDWYDRALTLCASEGATLVDAWKYFINLHNLGVDIRRYSYDGIHPNDAGYELISELIFQSMIADSDRIGFAPVVKKSKDIADFVSVYDADGGTVTTTTTISGLVTASTARKEETGEGTVEAFVLADGDTIEFDSPAPAQGFIVNMLGGVSGTVAATYNFVSIPGTFSAESGTVRESASVFRFSSGVSPYDLKGTLKLTSTGDTRILGVVFLCERTSNDFQKWIDATEVGTWSDSTFTAGGDVRESSTIGDYAELPLYGSMVILNYERGTDMGKFEWSVDGGVATEIDCYLNASDTKTKLIVDLGEEGWHTLKLEVTAKNPSSSANTVKFGEFRRYLGVATPDTDYPPQNAADIVDTRVKYEVADVVKTISGSPRAYDGIFGSEITLNGSGSAVVRLMK